MLTVISPAKSLDLTPQKKISKFTQPDFLDESEHLSKKLQQMSQKELSKLMGISQKLSELNHQRYAQWSTPFTPDNAKQAILTFNGDVYTGLAATTFQARDFTFAQKHLRILSGLYGVLKPLDLMQPYRLEMGTKLSTQQGKTLYDFWGSKITMALNNELATHKQRVLINLASNEYFKSVKTKELGARVVAPVFKEVKGGKSRIIALFAKKARGKMAAWIIQNRVESPNELTKFNVEGYEFQKDESTEEKFIFVRPQPIPVSA
ncbi:UPF0246 protein YaaA [hydrothermal vent metagenome]|uniref:UPF0246 protein YaaA n=1 Tax=hydrothermal vent metagenome TaxID=652676 RepID=A0A3B1DB62_9ZZZZ